MKLEIIKQFENEKIIDLSNENELIVDLTVDSIDANSGILLLKLSILNKDNIVLVQKHLKHSVPIGSEIELSILFNSQDVLYNNYLPLIRHILNNLRLEKIKLIQQALLLDKDQTLICTRNPEKHIWEIQEIFASGNFKKRICKTCKTVEKIGS